MKVVRYSKEIQIVSVATSMPLLRRVAILQRDDGYFTFAEEYYDTSEYEGEIVATGWQQCQPTGGIFDSAEMAEMAGRQALLQEHEHEERS